MHPSYVPGVAGVQAALAAGCYKGPKEICSDVHGRGPESSLAFTKALPHSTPSDDESIMVNDSTSYLGLIGMFRWKWWIPRLWSVSYLSFRPSASPILQGKETASTIPRTFDRPTY